MNQQDVQKAVDEHYLATTTTVEGIERIQKLMAMHPPVGSVRVTPKEFDDIAKTLDYRMDNWCDYDLIKVGERVIGYAKGRGEYGEIWLSKEFVYDIEWTGELENLGDLELVREMRKAVADWREAANGDGKQKLSHMIFLVQRYRNVAALRGLRIEQLLENI